MVVMVSSPRDWLTKATTRRAAETHRTVPLATRRANVANPAWEYICRMRCPSCGELNPTGFRFCGRCGAILPDATPERELRKVVTVVFCDLTGSTALGDHADPEALRAVMRGYYEQMRTILERHGGTVEKFVGDAVM